MNEQWWERPVCYLCNYGWLLLLLLLLGLGAYFTRNLWQPNNEPGLGTGDIQVTLRWEGLNDLDLHVIDPSGERIFFEQPTSQSGGRLDVDSNAGCERNMDSTPVENIFWPENGAPSGEYRVEVNFLAL